MTEAQVGFLYKAAASLPVSENHDYMTILKSYYLMRCRDITKGYGLEKHFSPKLRCQYCCIAWDKDTITRVKSVKLSKKQKYRIKHKKEDSQDKMMLLHSNKMEQICSFCKKSTITTVLKPDNIKEKQQHSETTKSKPVNDIPPFKSKVKLAQNSNKKRNIILPEVNVYSVTKDVFSLKNSSNEVSKRVPKVIKNNKKKKDKFAGLCKKAVQATIKLKQEKEKQNKLNLFLKPLSTL